MKIKINGEPLQPGERVTIEQMSIPGDIALLLVAIGLVFVTWVLGGGIA